MLGKIRLVTRSALLVRRLALGAVGVSLFGGALAFFACHASPETSGAPGASTGGPAATSIASTAAVGMATEEKAFHVDAASAGPCAHDTECAVRIHLVAEGKYHVNTEYPYRFVPRGDAGVSYLGTSAFERSDEKSGALAVRFKPTARGSAKVARDFKLRVCSTESCKIEDADILVDVPVL
jgi:hypothetical protein